MNKKYLVTGAEGFLGNHLINFLVKKKNIEVISVSKKKIKIKIKNVKYYVCNIKNRNNLFKIIKKTKPHYIFHLAAKSHPLFSFKNPIETISTNVIGTQNLLEAVINNKLKSKIIVACSSAQYGSRKFSDLPLKEIITFKPDHIYGLSKLFQYYLGMQYSKMFKMNVVNALIFNTSGPGKKNDVFYDLSEQFKKQNSKKSIILKCGNLLNQRDFLHYEDTIRGLYLLSQKGVCGESYNIATGKLIKIKQLIDYLKFKSHKKIIVKTNKKFTRKYDEKFISGNSKKLKKLGWSSNKNFKNILDEMCETK